VFEGGPVWLALNGEKRDAPFVEAVGEAVGLSAWSDVGESGICWVTADSRIDRIDEIDHIDGMSWLTTEIDPGEHSQIGCIRSRTPVASGALRVSEEKRRDPIGDD
jgi:hypothetical protein